TMGGLVRKLFWRDDGGLFSGSTLLKVPYATGAIPLVFAHLALSQLGWTLLSGTTLTPVGPSAGLDLAVLLVFGLRFWPVLFAAMVITTHGRGVAWAPDVGMSLANALRALAGYWLFTAIAKKKKFLGHFDEVAAIAGTALLSGLIPSALGT